MYDSLSGRERVWESNSEERPWSWERLLANSNRATQLDSPPPGKVSLEKGPEPLAYSRQAWEIQSLCFLRPHKKLIA